MSNSRGAASPEAIAAHLRRATAVNDLLGTLALTGDPESLDADTLIESTSIIATELQAALACLQPRPATELPVTASAAA